VANRFDLAPFQGAPIWGGRFPGLKPWAESCSPFGAGPPGPDHHLNDPTLPVGRCSYEKPANVEYLDVTPQGISGIYGG
jgi:hypothetical protein